MRIAVYAFNNFDFIFAIIQHISKFDSSNQLKMSVNIYLFFNGDCEQAMNFYKDATDGTIESLVRFSDTQMPHGAEWSNKIMHGVMHLNGATVMCSDAGEKRLVTKGDNFSISLDYKDESRMRIEYDKLAAGGQTTMPLQETFWGAIFGMCTDKFGVNWMFNHDKPKQ